MAVPRALFPAGATLPRVWIGLGNNHMRGTRHNAGMELIRSARHLCLRRVVVSARVVPRGRRVARARALVPL